MVNDLAARPRVKAWIDENGIHIPSYPEVLEDLQREYRAIYGQDTYLEPDSQDGALLAVFALRLYDSYTLATSVYNSYSPATAQGVGLSSVVKTNGIRRDKSSHSSTPARVIGQAGTIITRGVVTDDAERRWLLPEEVTIQISGEITVTVTAEQPGDIRAAAGEIKNIATPTRGWQAVINTEAATPGAPVELDARLRRRQSISTALPSLSIFEGIWGAIESLPGVTRCRGYENDTNIPDENGIPAHHICFVVEGGNVEAIGKTIAVKKGPGCGTYGTTDVLTRDKHGAPLTIRFFISTDQAVETFIRIKPLSGYTATTGEIARKNVAAYINNLDIGEDILHSDLYTPINAAKSGRNTFDVLDILIGPKGGPYHPANMAIAFNRAATCALEDVKLVEY